MTGVATGFARNVPTGVCQAGGGGGGYNTYSIMQAFWQLLHGYSCDPLPPFDCETVEWPDGVAPDDAVVPAFLYALRLAPGTYQQLFDNMATYVACNYGGEVYTAFNDVVCEHGLRSCADPAPTACGTCGNGVREGGEQCDGQDWGVAACEDLGVFSGGTLQCYPSGDPDECQLDLSMCIPEGLDSTADDGGPGGVDDGQADDDSTGTGASDGGGSGCECSSQRRGSDPPTLVVFLVLLSVTRRRRRAC